VTSRLSDGWIAAREALHTRYGELASLDDTLRLAYVNGPPRTFTNAEARDLWKDALARPVTTTPTRNQVYVHVPFCKSLCTFCNYERLKPSAPELLEAWLARVLGSLEVIAPVVRSLRFDSLYLGGGTPSVLTPDLFERLLSALGSALDWHPDASRHVEFDPQVMSREKLDVLVRHGFSRFSFGIESLDPAITRAHERGSQTRETIAKRFHELAEAGIDEVACDFLAGLAGTTPGILLGEIEEVVRTHRPSRIDVYMLTPTASYVKSAFGGDEKAFWAHQAPFEAALPAGLGEIAARTGYQLHGGSAHHAVLERPSDEPSSSRIRSSRAYAPTVDQARAPVHLLGFGPSARSQIFGYAAFTARDPAHDRGSAEEAYFEGHRIDLASECRSLLVHLLRESDVVERARFRETLGVDPCDVFPAAVAMWERLGVARTTSTALTFAPQERRDRTRALLWLVPEAALEHEIARRQGLDLSEDGVRLLLEGLRADQPLAGAWQLAGIRESRIVLRGPGGRSVPVRIAPRLEGRGLKLVPEANGPEDEPARSDLHRSIAALQKLLRERHTPGIGARKRHLPVA
jgi:coproporphyrinogen III oxidase-like Fe-S oxidoreductase